MAAGLKLKICGTGLRSTWPDIAGVYEGIAARDAKFWIFENRMPYVRVGDDAAGLAVDRFKDLGIVIGADGNLRSLSPRWLCRAPA